MCDSPHVTVNGQDPVEIRFIPTEKQPQVTCEAWLEEAHIRPPKMSPDIDIDVS